MRKKVPAAIEIFFFMSKYKKLLFGIMILFFQNISNSAIEKPNLDTLPVELQERVYSFLSRDERAEVRLVNKSINMVGRNIITFNMNSINENDVEGIKNFFRRHKEIKSLTIKEVKPEILERVLKGLNSDNFMFSDLAHFVIYPYLRGSESISPLLIEFLKHTMPNLNSLELEGCNLSLEGAQVISKMKGLIHLNIRNNNLGSIGARIISSMNNLVSLKIGNNKLELKGVQAIKAMKLSSLEVYGNNVGDGGAQVISTMPLTELDIGYNGLGPNGAQVISTMRQLRSLKIWNNDIGFEGARAIRTMDHLISLDIKDCGIGLEGTQEIKSMKNLVKLELEEQPVPPAS